MRERSTVDAYPELRGKPWATMPAVDRIWRPCTPPPEALLKPVEPAEHGPPVHLFIKDDDSQREGRLAHRIGRRRRPVLYTEESPKVQTPHPGGSERRSNSVA